MHNLVGPQMQEYALKERYALRARFRQANKSYEAYQKEFERLVRSSHSAVKPLIKSLRRSR